MKTWIYSWIVYPIGITIAWFIGLFSKKIRETIRLRSWKDYLSLRYNVSNPIDLWIHVASSGELEYAIPIIKEFQNNGKHILLTYYSISAKNAAEKVRDLYPNISMVVPLPHDGLGLMDEFVGLAAKHGVKALLLTKYELWPGMMWECQKRGIKIVLANALKPSWFHSKLIHKLDVVIAGYESEIQGFTNHEHLVSGDTRVERVLERAENASSKVTPLFLKENLESLSSRFVFILGSMWPVDDKVVLEFVQKLKGFHSKFTILWVPHELDFKYAAQVEKQMRTYGFSCAEISTLDQSLLTGDAQFVSVLRKGILAELYSLADLSYVGGGFTTGVHSVWEPSIFSAPILCGPKIERSPEARQLKEKNILHTIESVAALEAYFKDTKIPITIKPKTNVVQKENSASQAIVSILKSHLGASKRIVEICNKVVFNET